MKTKEERIFDYLELDESDLEDGQYYQVDWADDDRFFAVSICKNKTHDSYVYEQLDWDDITDGDDTEYYGKTFEIEQAVNTQQLTAIYKENDGRNWYIVNGRHDGTGCEFCNQEFARTPDGSIVDYEGFLLTPGDYDYIAIDSILPPYTEKKKPVTKLTAKETIKLMRKAIINYVADLPEGEISTGYFIKTVGTKYVHTVNTWDGSRIFKESIPSFYGGIPDRYKIVRS